MMMDRLIHSFYGFVASITADTMYSSTLVPGAQSLINPFDSIRIDSKPAFSK